MSLDHQTMGDYAPASPKRRISRARKAMIGFMAIGAFAATSGAGTFASFTASTDNAGGATGANNPFATGNFQLANTVTDAAGAALPGNLNPCRSNDDGGASEGTSVGSNAALCDVVFTGSIENGLTAYLKLENTGDDIGDLVMFRPTTVACEEDTTAGSTGSNCGSILLTVQEYFDDVNGNGPGEGYAVPLWGTDKRTDCVFGLVAAGAAGTQDDAPANGSSDTQGACTKGQPLTALPDFTNKHTIAIDLPAAKTDRDGDGTNGVQGNDDVRYFKIDAVLPPDATICADSETDFDTTTGIGCHNSAMDKSAKFTLRWMLIG